jgi:hypothetical protein
VVVVGTSETYPSQEPGVLVEPPRDDHVDEPQNEPSGGDHQNRNQSVDAGVFVVIGEAVLVVVAPDQYHYDDVDESDDPRDQRPVLEQDRQVEAVLVDHCKNEISWGRRR